MVNIKQYLFHVFPTLEYNHKNTSTYRNPSLTMLLTHEGVVF